MKITIHTTELGKGTAIEMDIARVQGESSYTHILSAVVGLAQSLLIDTTATKQNVTEDFLKAFDCEYEDITPKSFQDTAKKVHGQLTEDEEPEPKFDLIKEAVTLTAVMAEMFQDDEFMQTAPRDFDEAVKAFKARNEQKAKQPHDEANVPEEGIRKSKHEQQ